MTGPEVALLSNFLQVWWRVPAIFVCAFFGLLLLKKYLVPRICCFGSTCGLPGSDAAVKIAGSTRTWVIAVAAVYVALSSVTLPLKVRAGVNSMFVIVLAVQLTLWGNHIISLCLESYLDKRLSKDAAKATSLHALSFLSRVILLAVMVLWTLDNLGVNITTLIAGLGVGGVAVALAVQNILGDLFASFTIVLDKPFVIGDYIVVGDFQGTVAHVGIKTTRLVSLGGEQVIFANADLLQSRIRNYKRMVERRISFITRVSCDTSAEQLQRVPQLIKEAVDHQTQVRFDRSHFKELSSSSFNFETVYFVLTPDYTMSMDIQQAINLELVRRFVDERIQFAYPTQAVIIKQ